MPSTTAIYSDTCAKLQYIPLIVDTSIIRALGPVPSNVYNTVHTKYHFRDSVIERVKVAQDVEVWSHIYIHIEFNTLELRRLTMSILLIECANVFKLGMAQYNSHPPTGKSLSCPCPCKPITILKAC